MEYTIHTVKKDDSFNRLAHRYNCLAKEILDPHKQTVNPQQTLTITSEIHPGNKIHIPIKNKAADGTAYALFEFFNDEIVAINTLVNYYGITVKELNDYNGREIESPIINTPIKVPIKIYTTTDNKTTIESDNTSSLGVCTATACEDDLLIIQVTGINHPKGQRIAIEDKNDKELSSTDTKANITQNTLKKLDIETIKKDEQRLTCHLHKWDWDDKQTKDQRNLSLIIDKVGGGEIRLPFARDIGTTPRQNDAQLIQIVPIVPFTMVTSTAPDNYGVPALARAGYLYIYQDDGKNKGKLWREIQIKQDDKGKTTYHDIDIVKYYNTEEAKYIDDIRPAVGVALEEVWLPIRWRPKGARDLMPPITDKTIYGANKIGYILEYSEVQLSAARLNYLAANENHQAHPINNPGKSNFFEMGFSMADVKEAFNAEADQSINLNIETLLTLSNTYNNTNSSKAIELQAPFKRTPFPIKAMPAHRPREEQVEWLLERPAAYLYNSQGDYLSQSLQQATTKHQQSFLEGKYITADGLEISAWQVAILDNLSKGFDKQIAKLTQEIETSQKVQQLLSSKAANQSKTLSPDEQQQDQTDPNYIWQPLKFAVTGANDIFQQLSEKRIQELEDQRQQFQQRKANNQKLKAFWQNNSKPENALQDLQARDIYGCMIEDPHYQVRLLVKRLTDCHQTMTYVLEEIPQQEHVNSAILVQKTLAPVVINGKGNPLRVDRVPEFLKNGSQRIAKHSGSVQRHLLKQHYFNLQLRLYNLLTKPATQRAWADHLSLNEECSYAAAYLNAAQTFSLLGNLPSEIDPLHSPQEIVDDRINFTSSYQQKTAQEYLLSVSQDKKNPYHPMLWMEIKDEEHRLKIP